MVLELAYTCDAAGEPVPWNESRWCDEEFSTLLAKANATPEVEARREIMKDLELIQQDRGSIGNAYFFTTWIIMNKKFQDVHAHPTDYHLWADLWYDPEA
jgi:peptide/nickel transport system substrate-binding protein